MEHIKKFYRSLYQKLFLMNDSPQRIAIGFGLGVFLGILPFSGVVAAMALAWVFKLNETAAILGSVLTNTWLGLIVLSVSIHISCKILNLNSHDISFKFTQLLKNFHWNSFFDVSILKLIASVVLGYLIVSVILSFLAYGLCLAVICAKRGVR